MAIYHLTHRTVGRTTHAPGTAGAHLGYITRASACRAVIAEHIPEARPGSKGGEARAWMDAAEEADRKNARVIDKLEIALPLELDQAQRVELVRAFVKELAGGQVVPFFAAFHDKAGTKDAANPHAHLVIRDRDPATGKGRVIGMSEKGSTERAREVWERICNEALKQAGTEARIDRRSLVDQGITDRKPQGHEGPTPRQIEAKGKTSDKLERIRAAHSTPPKPDGKAAQAIQRATEAREAAESVQTDRKATEAAEDALEARREAQRAAQEAYAAQRATQAAESAQRATQARSGLAQALRNLLRAGTDVEGRNFEAAENTAKAHLNNYDPTGDTPGNLRAILKAGQELWWWLQTSGPDPKKDDLAQKPWVRGIPGLLKWVSKVLYEAEPKQPAPPVEVWLATPEQEKPEITQEPAPPQYDPGPSGPSR